jgi:ACR3 family arsenite efflux pump ArsB
MTFIFRILASFLSAISMSFLLSTTVYLFDPEEAKLIFSEIMLYAYLMLPFFLLIGIPVSILIDWYLTKKKKNKYLYHVLSYSTVGIFLTLIVLLIFSGGRIVESLISFSVLTSCALIYFHFLFLFKKWFIFYKNIPLRRK